MRQGVDLRRLAVPGDHQARAAVGLQVGDQRREPGRRHAAGARVAAAGDGDAQARPRSRGPDVRRLAARSGKR